MSVNALSYVKLTLICVISKSSTKRTKDFPFKASYNINLEAMNMYQNAILFSVWHLYLGEGRNVLK